MSINKGGKEKRGERAKRYVQGTWNLQIAWDVAVKRSHEGLVANQRCISNSAAQLLKSCQRPYRIPIGSCRNPDREFNTTSVRPIREHYSRGEWHACLVLGLSKTKHSDRGYTFRKRDVRSERQERDTGINPETRQEEVRPESVKLNLICKLNSKVQDLFLLILRGLVANPT